MRISRRQALRAITAAIPGIAAGRRSAASSWLQKTGGGMDGVLVKFEGARNSLSSYVLPLWFCLTMGTESASFMCCSMHST